VKILLQASPSCSTSRDFQARFVRLHVRLLGPGSSFLVCLHLLPNVQLLHNIPGIGLSSSLQLYYFLTQVCTAASLLSKVHVRREHESIYACRES